MNTRRTVIAAVVSTAAALALTGPVLAQSYSMFKVPLPMIMRTVVSKDVDGRMGRVAIDPLTGRMYVAAYRHGTLQVLDETGMNVSQVVKDLSEPQGVLVLSDRKLVLVSCGDGGVRVFKVDDKGMLSQEREIRLGGEADAMRLDPATKRVWVGHGKFLTSIDPTTGEKAKSIEFKGMVKGLVVESKEDGRVLVNVPSLGQVVAVSKASGEVVATWELDGTKGNTAAALDEANGRLFVASRGPGKLTVIDTASGKSIAKFDIADDADDVWYDGLGKRIYVSAGGGAGQVAMIRQENKDTYKVEHLVPTATGARTSVLSPERRRYAVVAPKIGDQPTFVYVYVVPNENESVPTGTKQP